MSHERMISSEDPIQVKLKKIDAFIGTPARIESFREVIRAAHHRRAVTEGTGQRTSHLRLLKFPRQQA